MLGRSFFLYLVVKRWDVGKSFQNNTIKFPYSKYDFFEERGNDSYGLHRGS